MTRRNTAVSRQQSVCSQRQRAGFTLVEMLIAMAITLVMVGAVVTLFANISNSVRNRRAVVEMSGQLRHARNMLQQDLQGATCPGLPWQRPDENLGYIEIIEGPAREGNASVLVDADPDTSPPLNWPPTTVNPEIDHTTSIIPASNLPFNKDPNIVKKSWVTDGGSLGDHDDILMLTVRNEHEPFVGRVPLSDGTSSAIRSSSDPNRAKLFNEWTHTSLESPLAEVVWYSVENPAEDANGDGDNDSDGYFGEPGMRTIYRRTLLIAPWLNPYRYIQSDGTPDDTFQLNGTGPTFTAQPGLLRILGNDIDNGNVNDRAQALAALIAFQERYDLSARLEWDPLLGTDGRWKIVANTLGDLTKRENRYEHHAFKPQGIRVNQDGRQYPFAAVSAGGGYRGRNVRVVGDREILENALPPIPLTYIAAQANLTNGGGINDTVANYSIDVLNLDDTLSLSKRMPVRPLAYIDDDSDTVATARAMLNDDGEVVRVVHGLVPLTGSRKGEDVMLTDALGFDLRVYDPGAPLYGVREIPSSSTEPVATILSPTDPAWGTAYQADMPSANNDFVGDNTLMPLVGQGAFVDLGYGFGRNQPRFATNSTSILPWFFDARALSDPFIDARAIADKWRSQLAPGYSVYDTWSFHYENNGVDEDLVNGVDQGTNGLDERDPRLAGAVDLVDHVNDIPINGPDDVGERETAPPYDKPLRGLQVLLRLYERDSRQVRQVSVNQHLVPE